MRRVRHVRAELGDQLVQVEWLGDVIHRAELQQRDGALDGPVTGDENPWWHVQLLGLQLLEQLVAVTVRQTNVADHDVVPLFVEHARRTRRGLVPVAVKSLELEAVDERLAHNRVIFDETNL